MTSSLQSLHSTQIKAKMRFSYFCRMIGPARVKYIVWFQVAFATITTPVWKFRATNTFWNFGFGAFLKYYIALL